jgi:hypothetical protein
VKGPGIYDAETSRLREELNAGILLMVIGGPRGSGFSAQLTMAQTLVAAPVLRMAADEMDRGMAANFTGERGAMPNQTANIAAGLGHTTVTVAGRYDGTQAAFERRCVVTLGEEQAKPNPDNALIALLCDAVRISRAETATMTPLLQVLLDAAGLLTLIASPTPIPNLRVQAKDLIDKIGGVLVIVAEEE